MNQSLFLSKVIRKANEKTKPYLNADKIVIVDRKTRQVISKKPFFGGDLAFYLVSNNNDPINFAERKNLTFNIKAFASDLEIGLNINYLISCPPGSEEKLAKALHSEDILENEMDKKVQNLIATFTHNNPAYFINNCIEQIPELTEYTKRNLNQELGVNVDLNITLKQVKELESFPITSIQFAVSVKDFDDELEISLGTELIIDESNKIKAILNHGQELLLVNRIIAEVRNYLLQNITLYQFCYELRSTVRDGLIEHLNQAIYGYGRQLRYLSLESNAEQAKPIPIPISSTHFSILVNNCNNELRLFIETEVTVDDLHLNNSIINYRSDSYLKERIIDWTKKYFAQNVTLNQFCSELRGSVRDRLFIHLNTSLVEYGRQLKYLFLNFDAEQLKPNTISIPFTQLPVFVQECDDELKLVLKTDLIVCDSNKAILYYGQESLLIDKVLEEIKNHLIQNVTLHKFCYELKTDIRQKLIVRINGTLSDYGRELRYLNLESDSVYPGQELSNNRSYDVECTVDGYPEAILVKSRLYMQPKDIGQYRLANSPNLEDWAEEKLISIIQPLLLQKKYIDVLVNFESIAEKIRTQMSEAASQIGYQITHLVSKPNLEPLKLLEGFNLEKEGTFSTRDARVEVNLKIFVTAKITNLEGIKNYLEQQLDVQELMKNSIYDSAREYLTQIEPERFYMRFLQHDKELNETKSVEKELSEKIKKELENKFSAQVSIVVPKPLDTKITKCYQSLNSQIGHFQFEILSLQGGEAVTYQGDFQVQAVEKNSWYIFQSRQPELNDIKLSIERSLNANLNAFNNEQLKYLDINNLSQIRDFINELAKINVKEQFGLEISTSNFARKRTELENSLAEARKQLQLEKIENELVFIEARKKNRKTQLDISSSRNQAHLKELEKLYQDRLAISGDEDSEEELKYINARIDTLEKEANIASLEKSKIEISLDTLEPKNVKQIGFGEAAKQMNLPISNSNPLLNPDDSKDTLGKEKDDNS